MSLYADYLKEREGTVSIETSDYFISYQVIENELHVLDFYVRPEKRKTKVVHEAVLRAFEEARKLNLEYVVGVVRIGAPFSHNSLMLQLKNGFRVIKASENSIVLARKV